MISLQLKGIEVRLHHLEAQVEEVLGVLRRHSKWIEDNRECIHEMIVTAPVELSDSESVRPPEAGDGKTIS